MVVERTFVDAEKCPAFDRAEELLLKLSLEAATSFLYIPAPAGLDLFKNAVATSCSVPTPAVHSSCQYCRRTCHTGICKSSYSPPTESLLRTLLTTYIAMESVHQAPHITIRSRRSTQAFARIIADQKGIECYEPSG